MMIVSVPVAKHELALLPACWRCSQCRWIEVLLLLLPLLPMLLLLLRVLLLRQGGRRPLLSLLRCRGHSSHLHL